MAVGRLARGSSENATWPVISRRGRPGRLSDGRATSATLIQAETVRTWVDRELAGDLGAKDGAFATAVAALAGGASVAEACRAARSFACSWARHPSHWVPRHTSALRPVI